MTQKYKIGKDQGNEIVIKDKNCPNIHAEINYDRGNWVLNNLALENSIYLNGERVQGPKQLTKYDKIKIYNQTIHWSNYLYEGENQELELIDFYTFNGRISRSSFRQLNLLYIGLTICLFLSPGFFEVVIRGRKNRNAELVEEFMVNVMPLIYIIGFSLIGITFLILAIKRIRDTGNSIWKIMIPIYNLNLLYFKYSKK